MSAPTNERIERMIEASWDVTVEVQMDDELYSIEEVIRNEIKCVAIIGKIVNRSYKFLAWNYTIRAFLDPAPKDPDYLAEKFGVTPGSYESDLITAIQRVVAAKIGGGK